MRTFLKPILFSFSAAILSAAQNNLQIYFIDVEGGAATLIVTPAGPETALHTRLPWAPVVGVCFRRTRPEDQSLLCGRQVQIFMGSPSPAPAPASVVLEGAMIFRDVLDMPTDDQTTGRYFDSHDPCPRLSALV